ncbi:MAG: hypothetical protein APR54_10975 [Candidatus Cloacimonas sp. SDB]|nr:MAG: hypothetical protein APR54_10975 [Candidatus Cloacimonas sp. SDB]
MSKGYVFLFVIILIFGSLISDTWKIESSISISMNQNYYSENWSGDEKGSISWVSNFDLLAEKQMSQKLLNKNMIKLAFGQTHNQYIAEESGDKKWGKPDKTTDNIDLESIMLLTLGSFVDPYFSLRLESQFLDESYPEETKSFNPNILTESVGISKFFIKEDAKEFSSRLGASFKQYLNSHEDIENTNDGGIELVVDYKTPLAQEVITYHSKLNVYKALFYSESEDLEGTAWEDDWKAPRVNWENTLTASITKLINLIFSFNLIYNETDYDMAGKSINDIQYKQTLSLGLSYKLK